MTNTPTDIAYEQDADGIFDLAVDADTRDWSMTRGLDSALFVSIFSDARAFSDEVADPMRRRGWTGDLVSDVPEDRHGSTLWFFEQARSDRSEDIRQSVYDSLEWLIDVGLITSREVSVAPIPASRLMEIQVTLYLISGGLIRRAFTIAQNTQARVLADI